MTIMITTSGQATLAKLMTGYQTPHNQRIKLYTAPTAALTIANVIGDFTELTSGAIPGYTYYDLTMANWVYSTSGGQAVMTYNAAITFSCTSNVSPVSVYGYYVIDSVSADLLWCEAFASSKIMQYNGDQIIITPSIQLTKQ